MSRNIIELSEISIAYSITQTAYYFKMAGLQFFKENNFGITNEQFLILYILYKENGLYQRQLCKIALKDRPNMTRLIDILEKRNLVQREIDPTDRRIIKVFITEKGKELVEIIIPSILEIRKRALDGLTTEETENLKAILFKIRNNLEETCKIQV